MLRRATLVGETTGGATHANVLRNLTDHFAIGIPEYRPVNPYSDKDWAITGVEPDVKVAADDALAVAERLAANSVASRPVARP
jgi:C-terminal processing protease CtpA/Prc